MKIHKVENYWTHTQTPIYTWLDGSLYEWKYFFLLCRSGKHIIECELFGLTRGRFALWMGRKEYKYIITIQCKSLLCAYKRINSKLRRSFKYGKLSCFYVCLSLYHIRIHKYNIRQVLIYIYIYIPEFSKGSLWKP